MKTAIIVQARMTSTRLPGKILRKILGQPMLHYQIERLKKVPHIDKIIIATTDRPSDQPVIEFCKQEGLSFFRGSEHDVLSRYYNAAKEYSVEHIVRITADCPVIDPQVIYKVISEYHSSSFDYVSNSLARTYPRGMDTEIFSFKTLEEAHLESKVPAEKEHVTPFIYNHPERYRLKEVVSEKKLSQPRLTVDTPEDFQLIEKIFTSLYPTKPDFSLEDILELFKKNPELHKINEHIEQKKL